MSLLAEQIPELHRKAIRHVFDADLLRALDEIALDVRGEDRDAGIGETLRQHSQRDRFAGARRAGDEAVPVGKLQIEGFELGAFADKDLAGFEHRETPVGDAALSIRASRFYCPVPLNSDPCAANYPLTQDSEGESRGRAYRTGHAEDRPR